MVDAQTESEIHREYRQSRTLSAHPIEIVQMLYELAIDSLNIAVMHFKDGDIFARGRAVSKAQAAVAELTIALDHSAGASFTYTLAALYAYVQRQMIAGHFRKSEQALQNARSVLETLAEGWRGVNANICGGHQAQTSAYWSGVEAGSRDWSC